MALGVTQIEPVTALSQWCCCRAGERRVHVVDGLDLGHMDVALHRHAGRVGRLHRRALLLQVRQHEARQARR